MIIIAIPAVIILFAIRRYVMLIDVIKDSFVKEIVTCSVFIFIVKAFVS